MRKKEIVKMGKLANIIINATGCSRLRGETAERNILAAGWELPHVEVKKPKKKKLKEESITHDLEISEVMSFRDTKE